jgi:hypothetical protein
LCLADADFGRDGLRHETGEARRMARSMQYIIKRPKKAGAKMFERILHPIDFDGNSLEALRFALRDEGRLSAPEAKK